MSEPLTHPLLVFARRLQHASTFVDLLDVAREEARATVGYKHVWLMVADDDNAEELRLLDVSGEQRERVWEVAPVLKVQGDAFLQELVASDVPIIITDARTDPRTNKALVEKLQNRTLINVPLRLFDKPLGIFGLGTFGDEGCRAPNPSELEHLIGMAGQMTVAASRIRYAESKARVDRQRLELERLVLERANSELEQRVSEATEELRRTNAALQRASLAKDEFLANMSHELRTPLNGVLGLTEALQEEVYGTITDRQRKVLKHVENSGRHLLGLISDILDVAKLDTGRTSLEIRPIAIGEACRASLAFVAETAREKRISVSVRISDGFATIHADERRLKQILVHLLSNALKFTPENGEAGLEVVADAAKSTVHFTVWDTGIGISPDDLARLFQPFVQVESSLSRSHQGSGLGLALVRRVVELHGGSVEAESEIGRGSRFTVRLPMRTRADVTPRHEPAPSLSREPGLSREPAPPLASTAGARPPRILIAEDDAINVLTVIDFLRMKGYEVHVARNGREALDLAERILPEAILMDLQMPIMDGLSATRALKADPRPEVRRIPVVALTAFALAGDRERCFEAGVADYLSKPVSLGRLVAVLDEVLAAR